MSMPALIERKSRWCCDCGGHFVQRMHESIARRALVRCAPCAAALWARICAQRAGRVLH